MMSTYLFWFAFLALSLSINGQQSDDRELPPVSYVSGRTAKTGFDAQFPRGRCPQRFFQLGDECLYFSIDGKTFSWEHAQRTCQRRVGIILQQPSTNPNQPNMMPTKGVRQLVLNTPEKTEILRAIFREYNEQNWAVSLPDDYDRLQRCPGDQDDKWPRYCEGHSRGNSTCFETISDSPEDTCLRAVECSSRNSRLVCEFTLPGGAEITESRFRHCTKVPGPKRRRLPLWLWILIGVGSAVILLLIFIFIASLIAKSRKNPKRPKTKRPEQIVIRPPPKRQDPANEPMLVRTSPINTQNDDYLQPQPLPKTDKNTNA